MDIRTYMVKDEEMESSGPLKKLCASHTEVYPARRV